MLAGIRHADLMTAFHTAERCWILEIANDTSDPGVSIARARVPPSVTTEWQISSSIASARRGSPPRRT
jgi:hypothetical protein